MAGSIPKVLYPFEPNISNNVLLLEEVYNNDLIKAEENYSKAINLNPNYSITHLWYGTLLWKKNQFEDAIKELNIAYNLDPLSPTINSKLGRFHYTINQDYIKF